MISLCFEVTNNHTAGRRNVRRLCGQTIHISGATTFLLRTEVQILVGQLNGDELRICIQVHPLDLRGHHGSSKMLYVT